MRNENEDGKKESEANRLINFFFFILNDFIDSMCTPKMVMAVQDNEKNYCSINIRSSDKTVI